MNRNTPPETAGAEQARGPSGQFARGRSGNLKGRPKGARNHATLAAEAMLDCEAERLTRRAIDMAPAGDVVALRLCLERIIPARRGRAVALDLPHAETAAEVLAAMRVVVTAMSTGAITPDEAATVAGILDAQRKAIETADLERRIVELERQGAWSATPTPLGVSGLLKLTQEYARQRAAERGEAAPSGT